MPLRVVGSRISPALAAAPFLLAIGCSVWSTHSRTILVTPHGAHDQYEVWVAARPHLLRGLAVEGDTVSGVPVAERSDCQACRVRFALAAVDSVRIRTRDAWRTQLLKGVAGTLVLVAITLVLLQQIAVPG